MLETAGGRGFSGCGVCTLLPSRAALLFEGLPAPAEGSCSKPDPTPDPDPTAAAALDRPARLLSAAAEEDDVEGDQ